MHPLKLFFLIFLSLIAASSVMQVLSMIRVNLLFDSENKKVSAKKTGTTHVKAGKNGLLHQYYGTYTCELGSFVSAIPFGKPEAVPEETQVIAVPNGGVLERCPIVHCIGRKLLPTWLAAGVLTAVVMLYAKTH